MPTPRHSASVLVSSTGEFLRQPMLLAWARASATTRGEWAWPRTWRHQGRTCRR